MSDAIVVEGVSKSFKRYPTRGQMSIKDVLAKGQFFKLRRKHDHIQALKDVTFSVPEGMVLGIIGPNGSGKSTLLKLLSGIYRPDTGSFSTKGRISALLSLGVGFHPDLTGRENVMIGGLAMGLSRSHIRRHFDEIVQFAELEQFIDAPVRTYSSGMYARLAFSISVHVDPDILLLDEVLAVGDAKFVEKSRGRMEQFKRHRKTILLVSHDLKLIANWCHEALWLENGMVRAHGKSGDIVDRYQEGSAGT